MGFGNTIITAFLLGACSGTSFASDPTACEQSFAGSPRLAPSPLAYELMGSSNGSGPGNPTLVFLHGMGGSRESFRAFANHYSKSFQTLIYDQRGHGDSPVLTHDYTLSTMAADLKTLVDSLGIKNVILIGHSMGARIAAQFAIDYPERVQSILLEDMDLIQRTQGSSEDLRRVKLKADEIRKRTEGVIFSSREEIKKALETLAPNDAAFWADAAEKVDENAFQFVGFYPSEIFLYWIHGNYTNLLEGLRGWQKPFYYLMADREFGWSAVTPHGAEQFLKAIPGGKAFVVKGTDHHIHAGKPRTFRRLLDQFLADSMSP